MHCWGHIYGPLYCGRELDGDPQYRKFCKSCLDEFQLHRYLCSYCCKSRATYEHNYCLSEQCPAKHEQLQGQTGAFGNMWTKDDKRLKYWIDGLRRPLQQLTVQERFEMLEYFHKDWMGVIRRHDKFEDQGARRIERRTAVRHTPYGNDCWGEAYMAAHEHLLVPPLLE